MKKLPAIFFAFDIFAFVFVASAQQIHIKVRFIETPTKVFSDVMAKSSLAGITNGTVLTNPNFRVLLHKLETSVDINELAEPEVTTMSGRQTEIRVTEAITVFTNSFNKNFNMVIPQNCQIEIGPVLDVNQKIRDDGYTINLETTLDYVATTNLGKSFVTNAVGEKMELPQLEVFPAVQINHSSAHATLYDGQTLVLFSKVENATNDLIPETESNAFKNVQKTEKNSGNKILFVFVTPTLIDAAGNRIHSDDEMPFAEKEIPLQ